jgi:hypothetical protein
MTINKEATKSGREFRPICITLRDGVAVDYKGWIEENANGSITVHDAQGNKTIYLKDEYREWHFDESGTLSSARMDQTETG